MTDDETIAMQMAARVALVRLITANGPRIDPIMFTAGFYAGWKAHKDSFKIIIDPMVAAAQAERAEAIELMIDACMALTKDKRVNVKEINQRMITWIESKVISVI